MTSPVQSRKIQLAMSGGLNWNWYLVYEIDSSTNTIIRLAEDRFHRFDSLQGADLDTLLSSKANNYYEVIEHPQSGSIRIATGIKINEVYYPFKTGNETRFVYHCFDWKGNFGVIE